MSDGRAASSEIKVAAVESATEITKALMDKLSTDWFLQEGTSSQARLQSSARFVGSLTGIIARQILDRLYEAATEESPISTSPN